MKNLKLLFAKSLFLMVVVFISACQNEEIEPTSIINAHSQPSHFNSPPDGMCDIEGTDWHNKTYAAGTVKSFSVVATNGASYEWFKTGGIEILSGKFTRTVTVKVNGVGTLALHASKTMPGDDFFCSNEGTIGIIELCNPPSIQIIRGYTQPEAGYPFAGGTLCKGGEVDFQVRAVGFPSSLGSPSSIVWSSNMPNSAHDLIQNASYLTLNSFDTASAIGYWDLNVTVTWPDGCTETASITQNVVDCGSGPCFNCP